MMGDLLVITSKKIGIRSIRILTLHDTYALHKSLDTIEGLEIKSRGREYVIL